MSRDEETLEWIDNLMKAYEGESEETVCCLRDARDTILRLKKEVAGPRVINMNPDGIDRQSGAFSQDEIDNAGWK